MAITILTYQGGGLDFFLSRRDQPFDCFGQEQDIFQTQVPDRPLRIEQRHERIVCGIGSLVEQLVEDEIAVQVHVVGVDAAAVFHPPGIDGVDEQQPGIFGVELRGKFFDENFQHGRAHIAFDAMLSGGDDDEVFFLARLGPNPVDGQVGVVLLADGFPGAHPAIWTGAGSGFG